MAHVFVSYAREDQPRVSVLVQSLQKSGLEVWWDPDIRPGTSYDETIDRELENAECVLVIWSRTSIKTPAVRDEARRALQRNVLIPVMLDDCEPPLGLRGVQAIAFPSAPSGSIVPAQLHALLRAIANIRKVTVPPTEITSAGVQSDRRTFFFFDRSKGRDTPLADFPHLLRMEAHTGFSGVFFTLIWYVSAWLALPDIRTDGAFLASGLVVLGLYLGLGSLSLLVSGSYEKVATIAESQADFERKHISARKWITVLSASYIALTAGLIWLTGGAYSPFVPFYVMTFTLTIARNRILPPGIGFIILAVFLVAIGVASFGHLVVNSPIAAYVYKIQQQPVAYFVGAAFIGFSLLAPTLSALVIEKRERTAGG